MQKNQLRWFRSHQLQLSFPVLCRRPVRAEFLNKWKANLRSSYREMFLLTWGKEWHPRYKVTDYLCKISRKTSVFAQPSFFFTKLPMFVETTSTEVWNRVQDNFYTYNHTCYEVGPLFLAMPLQIWQDRVQLFELGFISAYYYHTSIFLHHLKQ